MRKTRYLIPVHFCVPNQSNRNTQFHKTLYTTLRIPEIIIKSNRK